MPPRLAVLSLVLATIGPNVASSHFITSFIKPSRYARVVGRDATLPEVITIDGTPQTVQPTGFTLAPSGGTPVTVLPGSSVAPFGNNTISLGDGGTIVYDGNTYTPTVSVDSTTSDSTSISDTTTPIGTAPIGTAPATSSAPPPSTSNAPQNSTSIAPPSTPISSFTNSTTLAPTTSSTLAQNTTVVPPTTSSVGGQNTTIVPPPISTSTTGGPQNGTSISGSSPTTSVVGNSTTDLPPGAVVSTATNPSGTITETFLPTTYSGFENLTSTLSTFTLETIGSSTSSVPIVIGPSGVGWEVPTDSSPLPLPTTVPTPGSSTTGVLVTLTSFDWSVIKPTPVDNQENNSHKDDDNGGDPIPIIGGGPPCFFCPPSSGGDIEGWELPDLHPGTVYPPPPGPPPSPFITPFPTITVQENGDPTYSSSQSEPTSETTSSESCTESSTVTDETIWLQFMTNTDGSTTATSTVSSTLVATAACQITATTVTSTVSTTAEAKTVIIATDLAEIPPTSTPALTRDDAYLMSIFSSESLLNYGAAANATITSPGSNTTGTSPGITSGTPTGSNTTTPIGTGVTSTKSSSNSTITPAPTSTGDAGGFHCTPFQDPDSGNPGYCECSSTISGSTSYYPNYVFSSGQCPYTTVPPSSLLVTTTTTSSTPIPTTTTPAPTTSSAAPPPPAATCSFHLKETISRAEDINGRTFHLWVTGTQKDGSGNQIAAITDSHTELPATLGDIDIGYATNPGSNEELEFTVGSTSWDTRQTDNTQMPYCNVGGYDNGSRQMDCFYLC